MKNEKRPNLVKTYLGGGGGEEDEAGEGHARMMSGLRGLDCGRRPQTPTLAEITAAPIPLIESF